jgi:hypothetical protein
MQSESDFIIQLMPLLIVWLILLLIALPIAKRKGVSRSGKFLGCFPLWIGIAAVYWASLTDKEILERLDRLEGRR